MRLIDLIGEYEKCGDAIIEFVKDKEGYFDLYGIFENDFTDVEIQHTINVLIENDLLQKNKGTLYGRTPYLSSLDIKPINELRKAIYTSEKKESSKWTRSDIIALVSTLISLGAVIISIIALNK